MGGFSHARNGQIEGEWEVHKRKPWLRFVEGVEGGSATDDTPDDTENQDARSNDDQDVDWKAKYESMRAEMRKQEERAKANKDAADKLKQLEEAGKSDDQKMSEELAEAQKAAADAQLEVRRYRMAAKYGLTDEQADLYLTDPDEERMEEQAKGLSEMATKKPRRRDLGDSRDRTPPAPTLKSGADLWSRVKANNNY